MATEYTCITRKIEVHLHKHGDGEEAEKRRAEEFRMWNEINDNLYKAANRIVSHCFFNDAYEYRLKIQSPRYKEIQRKLRYSKSNKLTDDEIKSLKAERKELDNEFRKQYRAFMLGGSSEGFKSTTEQNSTERIVNNEFGDIIPSNVLSCLNQNVFQTYKQYRTDVEFGKRTISNFKKGMPVPFSIKAHKSLMLKKREDGSIFVYFPKGLEWDLSFGRDRSNNREIVERILSGQYDAGTSSLQEGKNGKIFLLLVVKIPKQSNALDPNRVVGVDLGINIALYAALSDNEYACIKCGFNRYLLKTRTRMVAQLQELQHTLRLSTNGGRGRGHKMQALERFKSKERNWVHLQNHIFSKNVIEFAVKNKAGTIQMERLTGFGRDINDRVEDRYQFALRNWSYFELQSMIEYKAEAAGIEVRYIDPYHTSQTCSFCGHYEEGQRINQPTFVCKNPECEKGKGKKRSDGTYTGINADWNAARNIALSDKFVDKKKK